MVNVKRVVLERTSGLALPLIVILVILSYLTSPIFKFVVKVDRLFFPNEEVLRYMIKDSFATGKDCHKPPQNCCTSISPSVGVNVAFLFWMNSPGLAINLTTMPCPFANGTLCSRMCITLHFWRDLLKTLAEEVWNGP